MGDVVRYSADKGIARITLVRPEAMNALDPELETELAAAWQRFAADESAGVAILAAEGPAFSAGADLKSFIPAWEEATAWDLRQYAKGGLGGGLTRGAHRLAKPVIAAIDGAALGAGFELALACDIRLASTRARFAVPELQFGLHQGDGGLTRLLLIAGLGVALDLTLTGREIDADEALRLRLVSAVVEPDALHATAENWARRILSRSARALASAKETLFDVVGRSLDDALRLEALNGYSCLGDFSETRRRLEAFAARKEKRS